MTNGEPSRGIIQTIEAESMDAARSKLYALYGTDYEIKSHELKYKEGLLGFRRKPYMEVKYMRVDRSARKENSFATNQEELLKKLTGTTSDASIKQISRLDRKFDEFARTFNDKMAQLATLANLQERHPSIQKIETLLEANEFTASFIAKITDRLKAELSVNELDDFDFVQDTVVDWLAQSIHITSRAENRAPHIIVLVGPTGVGKTTTISKLATLFIKEAKAKERAIPRIKMITTDRTRVGAAEQLERFGSILNIPVDTADDKQEFKKFIAASPNFDVILVDTSGYGPKEYENIAKTRSFLDIPGMTFDCSLVLSASTKSNDIRTIIQNYEAFNFDSVIVTKLDETDGIGNVISVLSEKAKGISYICDGQYVAEDIKNATVLSFLQKLTDFNIDRVRLKDSFPEE